VSTINRHICLAVLLGLLIGHVSVAVHAASHGDTGATECELCISYGDVAKALTTDPAQHLAPVAEPAARLPAVAPAGNPDATLERQRGPPLQH
jgi:hypothetical protein